MVRRKRWLMLLLCGCTLHTEKPIPVSVAGPISISTPEPAKPWCGIDTAPVAPTLREIDTDNPDIIGRVMIHRDEYAEMIDFVHDQQMWDQQMLECLRKLIQ